MRTGFRSSQARFSFGQQHVVIPALKKGILWPLSHDRIAGWGTLLLELKYSQAHPIYFAEGIFQRGKTFCAACLSMPFYAFLAFLCVFVCVVYRTWMKHTRFERSLLLQIFYLSGFAVSSITGWNTTFIGCLSNINQFPRSVASYFPLASFRDILTSTGYTLQGDWPQKT